MQDNELNESFPDESADTGTVLGKDCWAIVWHPKEGFTLSIPSSIKGGNRQMRPEELAMTECFMRLDTDDDYVREMRDGFLARTKTKA